MIAPKSAIEPAAMTSCPNVEAISPASLSTGISTPSEVAQRMIATSSGVSTRPAALQQRARPTSAIPNESAKPSRRQPQHRPAQPREVDLQPGQEEQEREPEHRDHLDRLVDLDRPEHATGRSTIPATISSTTDGSRTRGKRPSTKGAAKATATTISRPLNEGMRGSARSRSSVTARSGSSEAAPPPKLGRSARRRGRRAARHRSGCHPRSAPSTGADRAPVPTTHTAAAGGDDHRVVQ